MEAEGWYRDPFGAHTDRWTSTGVPTGLVRDGGLESHDEPPASAEVTEPLVPADEEEPSSDDLLRAGEASERMPNLACVAFAAVESAPIGPAERWIDDGDDVRDRLGLEPPKWHHRGVTREQPMFRVLTFPFDENKFPVELGAVVQRTVLDGSEPARVVVHAADGSWLVGDGIHDPNLPGTSIATHIWHAIERNTSLRELATMSPGYIAQRGGPGEPWRIEPHAWAE